MPDLSNITTESEQPRWCLPVLSVELLEPKPNKMFTEEHRQMVRFLRYTGKRVPCSECAKRKQTLWTMLCSFQALDMAMLVPKRSGKIHPPLTPVCQTHLLAPEMVEVDEQGKAIAKAEGRV